MLDQTAIVSFKVRKLHVTIVSKRKLIQLLLGSADVLKCIRERINLQSFTTLFNYLESV